jgi:phosphohistidine phosphatase
LDSKQEHELKTLFLLRHADANAQTAGQDDIDRLLSDRGRGEAGGLPARFARHAAIPTHCICSAAHRAVETLDGLRASPEWPRAGKVEIDPALYLAGTEALLERLGWIEDGVDRLLLVAHNPGIALLARTLAKSGDAAALDRLGEGFAPAALAVLEFDVDQWANIATKPGRLIDMSSPNSTG